MSNAALLKVYDGQEPDLCFGAAPGPGGVNSVGVGAGLVNTGTSPNPVVSLGMSAVGDLLVGTGVANSGAVLPKGANGNFLRVKSDGTGLEYAAVAPGGVDSVSAAANNVGLVLTTAPATPADPQIGLAFTAKTSVPVGTAANTGVMVSAPLPLTTGLVLQTDTGEPSGVKWAPAAGPTGVISTLPPLLDTYSAPDNKISINFSTTAGEIPYGTGVALTGDLLAPPTGSGAVGKVLTYNGITPGQPPLAWTTPVQPVGGDTIIIHTNTASNIVPVPNDKDTSLILVAGELQASWDKIPSPLPAGATYAPELIIRSNVNTGSKEYLAIAATGGAQGRAIELFDLSQTPAELIGTFEFITPGGGTGCEAQMFCYCNGDNPYNPAQNFFVSTDFADRIILGGKFNSYLANGATQPITPYGICVLNISTTPAQIEYIYDQNPEIIFGFTNSNDPVNDTTTEIHSIIAFPANALAGLAAAPGQQALTDPGILIGGTFDTIHATDGSGQAADIQGYGGLALLDLSPSVEVLDPGPMKNLGLWIADSANPTPPTCSISVAKMCFDSTYSQIFFVGINFTYLAINQDGTIDPRQFLTLSSGNSSGFIVYDSAAPFFASPTFNVWIRNNDLGQIPPFNTQDTYDIAPSSQIAQPSFSQHYILSGGPGVYFFVDTATPWTSPVFIGGEPGYYNSILINQVVNQVSPTPNITADWIVSTNIQNQTQYVGYVQTATGTTIQNFTPSPTGVVGPLVDSIKSPYGIQATPGSLLLGGTDGEYKYDAQIHADIEFSTTPPMFWKVPAGTSGLTKASFSASYQSQSYISSADKAYWIQVGGANPNLAYS